MNGDKPMTNQTSLENLLQKPSLLVNTPRARKEGARGGRKESERKKETKVLPAMTKCIQGHTKEEGLPAMTQHPGTPREEGEERKESRKEGERERKGEERKVFPATNDRPGTHQKKERGDLEYSIQENPRKQREEGGGKGEKGVKFSRQTPMSL